MSLFYTSVIILLSITYSNNVHASQVHQSKYVGQEKRIIKSLSTDDIEQLQSGKGWGLAKAAELNGMPGPSHILQMKKEIALTATQEEQIKHLYNDMKAKAIPLGKKLIALEKDLNHRFADKSISSKNLIKLLDLISNTRAQLRYVHLATHLQTPNILSQQQVDRYNQLRGYGSGDPCNQTPTGHDPAMWKKHNGCR